MRYPRLTLVACLAGILLPTPARATYPGQNGLIAFDINVVSPPSEGLTLINPDGTDQHTITDRGSQASWSADGSTIYFTRYDNFINEGIWSIHPDGSGLTRVTEPKQWWDISPWPMSDGSVVFESNRGHPGCCDTDLWLKVPGQKAFRLTATPDEDMQPVASPDGRRIAFIRFHLNVGSDLMVMNADGTHPRVLVRGVDWSGIDWSPDGTLSPS